MTIFSKDRTPGSTSGVGTNGNDSAEAKADFWLNVGYETGDEKYPFVSLAQGIALDKIADKAMSNNPEYSQLCQAQNALRDELIAEGSKLAPGETAVISHPDMPLAIQIRRVNPEGATAPSGDNPLMRSVIAVSE